jgi:thiol-disulfide isomerase/thioredoxin
MLKKVCVLFICYLLGLGMGMAQTVQKINSKQLASLLNRKSDTVYVLNFWATWCKPCVAELPSFDSLQTAYKNQPVKITLISNDFEDELQTKLIPFLQRKKPMPQVLLLTETDANVWLPLVDKNWTGAIPVTLIYYGKSGKRDFISGETNFADLKKRSTALLQP